MLNIIKYPATVQISNCIIIIIFFFPTFHLNQECFSVRSSGDERAWKPVFYTLIFLSYRHALSFPLRRWHSKGKDRYLNPKPMATLPQYLEKSLPLLSLWFLWEEILFFFVLVWNLTHHLLSVFLPTFPAMPRPGEVRLSASSHAWLRRQLIKKP